MTAAARSSASGPALTSELRSRPRSASARDRIDVRTDDQDRCFELPGGRGLVDIDMFTLFVADTENNWLGHRDFEEMRTLPLRRIAYGPRKGDRVQTLVERFDIEPFSDFSAK